MAIHDRGAQRTITTRPGSCRARVVEYIASQGGELRSDSGVGIRRQIADALGERPTVIGQALLGLERGGLIERELDMVRQRCHAIRLVTPEHAPASNSKLSRRRRLVGQSEARADHGDESERQVRLATQSLRADRDRLERRLKETERELGTAIRRGVELARRIEDLESRLDGDEEVSPSLLVTLDPELWWASVAGVDGGDQGGASEADLAQRRSTAGQPRP